MWFKAVVPVLLLISATAWSALVDLSQKYLYDTQDQKDRYGKAVAMIRPGDVVHFSDGAQFTIEEKLGEGGLCYIYSIRERPNQVLRLANSVEFVGTLDLTIRGFQELKDSGIRAVKIDPQSTKQYVLAERISSDYLTIAEMVLGTDFGQKRFFYNGNYFKSALVQKWRSFKTSRMPKLDPEIQKKMYTSFLSFIKSIAPFYRIMDLHEGNVVYDRNRNEWVIIDWLDGSTKLNEELFKETASGQRVSDELLVLMSSESTVNELFEALTEAKKHGFKFTIEAEQNLVTFQEDAIHVLMDEKTRIVKQLKSVGPSVRCDALLKKAI